ncbi:protein CURVATURE THYLAKOID 1D, chloroplastic [Sesamum alatum]|uniref:Protein CURVATURE THYLAKOID 1D, chloroplastic n=1 Tax=Sesamum alatum TaxID=300844 RepID=A0AAE1YHU1_9LAMI|nr:protein CURVATURE THYLAKOID 1D, chloroplastic [Sesamum alatum]
MELCTARGISVLPKLHTKNFATSNVQFPSVLLRCKTHFPFLQKHTRLISGSRYYRNSSLRSTSEETSTGTTPYVKDGPEPDSDSVITVGDNQPVQNDEDYDSQQNEAPQEGSLLENLQLLKFLEDLDIKFDYEDTYSILVFGGGGAVALWLLAAVVSAIDSIPVFPKVLELVGLGYTVWFSSRYLIFKKNRDELVAKIEQIKQQVLGSKDE